MLLLKNSHAKEAPFINKVLKEVLIKKSKLRSNFLMTNREAVTRIRLWTWILFGISTTFDSCGLQPQMMNI